MSKPEGGVQLVGFYIAVIAWITALLVVTAAAIGIAAAVGVVLFRGLAS